MKISIITPSYNSIKFIEETILSVLAQTYQDWEMIIVNDVSTDGSEKFIEEYVKKDSRIKLIKLSKNSGAAKARNRAIEEATGRYIAFLDSDDTWLPNKLEKQVTLMQEYNLALTYSAYHTMDETSKYINTRKVKDEITYKDMLKSNHIGNLTGMYDVEFFGKVFMESVGHEDYVLWLSLLKKVGSTKGVTEPLGNYRILSNSLSSNKVKVLKWQWHIYRKVEKLNLFESSYYFMWYVFYALKKRS